MIDDFFSIFFFKNRYLYNQLQVYAKTPNDTIITQGDNGKLRVLADVTFHLYISTAPCGDGAQFSRTDAGENEEGPDDMDFCGMAKHLPTFGKTSQGLLRTKMEQGKTNQIRLGFGLGLGFRIRIRITC